MFYIFVVIFYSIVAQVRRTKEMLSANTGAPLSVEEMHGGEDFRTSITRQQMEELAGDFFKR